MDATVIKLLGTILDNESIVTVLREMANEAVSRLNASPEPIQVRSKWYPVIHVLRESADQLEGRKISTCCDPEGKVFPSFYLDLPFHMFNVNCYHCGASYASHELDMGNGFRAHRIDAPGNPQHGQVHFYIPQTQRIHEMFLLLINQGET